MSSDPRAGSDHVEELEREIRRLRNLETAKSQFLATVSHELRTPLTAILAYADALSDQVLGELNERQHDAVGSISSATRQLLEMVEEILTYARSGGQEPEIRPEEFEARELLRQMEETHESLFHLKEIRFRTEVREDTPPLFADLTKTAHALGNLVSNAIDFTPEGGEIRVRVGPEGEEGEWVRVEVQDSGPGVAEEERERIFEEFVVASSGEERVLGGTGLGLSIARRFVKQHGGEIGVDSQVGVGSNFHFTLPTARNEPFRDTYGGGSPTGSGESPDGGSGPGGE